MSSFGDQVAMLKSMRKIVANPNTATDLDALATTMSIIERPQDVALTTMFTIAVMQESLEGILEVVDLLLGKLPSDGTSPRILPWAEPFVLRLLGDSTSEIKVDAGKESPTSSAADTKDEEIDEEESKSRRQQVMSSFFTFEGVVSKLNNSSSAAPTYEGLESLFGSLNWLNDPVLSPSDRQAVAILEAVSNILAATSSAAFAIMNDAFLELLLLTAERGALAMRTLASLQREEGQYEFQRMQEDSNCRREVYLGSASLNIIYHNLLRKMISTPAGSRANLLDVASISDSLEQAFNVAEIVAINTSSTQPSTAITYRERILRLTSVIYSNALVNPEICEFGENAVMFADLREILTPRAAQQFSIICNLLEKSDSGLDTYCERALVIKLMDGMEGPKLLELLTPSASLNNNASSSNTKIEQDDDVERFVKSILMLADRSVIGKIRQGATTIRESLDILGVSHQKSSSTVANDLTSSLNPSTSGGLAEGMLRVLEPITIQTFSTIAHSILVSDNEVERDKLSLRLVEIIRNLLQSANSILVHFNASFRDSDNVDKKLLESSYSALTSELAKSHIASLAPLTLLATSLLWKDMIKQNRRNLAECFVKLFKPLCMLLDSINDCEILGKKILALTGIQSQAVQKAVADVVRPVTTMFTPVLHWDVGLSSSHLLYSGNNNNTCTRPGSVSCYPAAFAVIPTERASITITITEANSTTNWLTMGLCGKGFATGSSDGIGRTANSWYSDHL